MVMLITVSAIALLNARINPPDATPAVSYSQFLRDVQNGDVTAVRIEDHRITGVRPGGESFTTTAPHDPALVDDLLANEVEILVQPPQQTGWFGQMLVSSLPLLLLFGMWMAVMRRGTGGLNDGSGLASFGKSRARMISDDQVKVKLDDVAGIDEVKTEVAELVDFLRNPDRFLQLGGRIPRGILMAGPPGTGKTLLAKAIAGEAGVPFFSIAGSDFVEMFVGVGAARVRDLFEQAKKHAPCIIFIDEIDAVGRRRGTGMGGGHDEREQTLNQLLVEMDGFSGNEGVIVIAATNRPDALDAALLRPGRFDRQITVPLPDVAGREQILNLHLRKVPVADDVDIRTIARGTPGFSGADLANLVNEAALSAARAGRNTVGRAEFEQARDKAMMGAERRSMVMSEEEKRLTAYHEAGHALVGLSVPGHDLVHKVSIIPRGRALGVTVFLPERDAFTLSRQQLEGKLAGLFGGRIAEELVFGPDAVTTGAQNDIQAATDIARNMVIRWGLSEKLGPLCYEEPEQAVFLGGGMAPSPNISERTTRLIDSEVRRIIERNYHRAKAILENKLELLHKMAAALMEYETLDSHQIDAIVSGHDPRPPAGHDDPRGTRPPRNPQCLPGPALVGQPAPG